MSGKLQSTGYRTYPRAVDIWTLDLCIADQGTARYPRLLGTDAATTVATLTTRDLIWVQAVEVMVGRREGMTQVRNTMRMAEPVAGVGQWGR